MNNMLLQIPTEPSFHCPADYHRAILTDVCSIKNDTQYRFKYGVGHDGKGGFKYVMARKYEKFLMRGSPLRNMLKSWRGHDLTHEEIEDKTFDFTSLIGKEADIEVTHYRTVQYDQPFVNLNGVFPPG